MPRLTILKDTIFKISTDQSSQLGNTQKASVTQGQSFEISSAELEKGHYLVKLTAPIVPVGVSGYFFAGHVQIEGLDITVPSKIVRISQEGRKWFAVIDSGHKFYVGSKTSYRGGDGLYNYEFDAGKYSPDNYRQKYGFWADFIYPTVMCESNGSFTCLNTYDRAYFTFGFLQYAAHVPTGDFVKFFCELLGTSLGKGYFSDLEVRQGNIFKLTSNRLLPLTSDQSTQLLMKYLNPTINNIEEIEIIQAAKFVHWATSSQEHRDIQVKCGIEHFKVAMKTYAKWYPLDGAPEKVCLVIADIHHQGRASQRTVKEALDTDGNYNTAFDNLTEIGKDSFPERRKTLKRTIKELETKGILGNLTYSQIHNNFV